MLIATGTLMCIGTLLIFYLMLSLGDTKAGTMAFTTLIMFQLFYALSCRSEKYTLFKAGILSNRYLILAVIFSILMQVAVVYLPIFQNVFGTVALGPVDWLMIIAVSITAFIIPELWKLRK